MADTVAGANPDTHAAGDDPNRRDFIHIAAAAAAGGAVAGLAWPFIDRALDHVAPRRNIGRIAGSAALLFLLILTIWEGLAS